MSSTSQIDEPVDVPAVEAIVEPFEGPARRVAADPAPDPIEAPVDGRTARSVRTREAIVDACIELIEAGDLRPTGPRIAEGAGVSVRSIFQHFDDLETLYAAVGARVVERLARLTRPMDPQAPVQERAAQFVRQRCDINEALSPTLRAAVVHAPGSTTINRQFQAGHDYVRSQVAEVFAAELDRAGEAREAVFDGILVAVSWTTWNLLRTLEHRSADDAARAVARMVALVWLAAGEGPAPAGAGR